MSITEKVKQDLRVDINSGLYPGGCLLPTRHALMEKYSISRGSIDKVIRQLVEEGVLESHQGSGTYVRSQDNKHHIYIILNNDVECAESNKFNGILSMMLSEINDLDYSIHCSSNIEEYFSEIILNPSSRVIWSRPSIRARYYIKKLKESKIAQILINRSDPNFNYFATDTYQAIEQVSQFMKRQKESPRIGLLVPPLSEEEPFLAVREIYFQESLHKHDLPLAIHQRTASKSINDVTCILSSVFKGTDLDYLFVPDHDMLPVVLTYMAEKGHSERVKIISFDGELDPFYKGSMTIRQDWKAMFEQAISWASDDELLSPQVLVMPEIIHY
ncbi:transcriptional regulator, GntR family protein [Lentisphaera araneosa HTCC2155]|uniref:Transcriptional regulator, GntR family protein n=1 Tax=Lentisphaera araneosa HTCC2155 TaxID=313628 RepID=A6DP64_9BACT|nr:GntR family transcriptional regulator [Lentisphaera araneosa]EDM26596.1 transcriptional regulator, GntR family protein [Lentisphaera araneosa HTCC2155]